jgi:hypothetical protein
MTTTRARNALVTSSGIISILGGLFVFAYRVNESVAVAVFYATLFIMIVGCMHGIGYILYLQQVGPPPVEEVPQKAICGISPQYWSAFKEALIGQSLIGIPTSLLLDGGRAFAFFETALLGHWIAILLIVWRRPMTPTKFDLSFIRIGILPMCLLPGLLTPLVWRIIGESDLSGWQRLLDGWF